MKRLLLIQFILLLSLMVGGTTKMNRDNPTKGSWEFKPVKLWETDSAGGEIFSGGAVATGRDGTVYYLDRKQSKVYILDKTGKFTGAFGKKGEGPGEFKMAYYINTLEDKVIVPDMGKYAVFSARGEFLQENKFLSQMRSSTFIDENRIIFIKKDKDKNEIVKTYDFKTKEEKTIDVFPARKDIIAQAGGMRLVLMVTSVHTFFRAGYAYYGKDTRFQIKKADINGKILLTFGIEGRKKTRVTEEMKIKSMGNVKINGAPASGEMLKQMIRGIPDEAPFYNRIYVDSRGFIYIFRTSWENTSGPKIDLFSPRGVYLYASTLVLPDGLTLKSRPAFYQDRLVAFVEDEDGEGKLAMFKIALPAE